MSRLLFIPGLLTDRRGAVTVEFALLTPVLMLLMLSVIDFGMAFHEKMQLESASRAGLQFAVHDYQAEAQIRQVVLAASSLPADQVTVTVSHRYDCNGAIGTAGTFCGDGSWPATIVTISARKRFDALFTLYGLENVFNLEGTAEGRVL